MPKKVLLPKPVQLVPKPAEGDTKHKKIFQSRMSPSGFVGMIAHFNEAQTKAIQDMGFGGFLHLQVTELPGKLCKWLVDRFDPYSVTLYISLNKMIEIAPMDVHITLVLPIGGRKVEEFYGKKPKDAKYNKVLNAWRKDWNLQDGTPKLSQMPQYILSQTDAGESFKRNFVMYMVSYFFNGSKNNIILLTYRNTRVRERISATQDTRPKRSEDQDF
ncbi:hypothetical protein Cgig2_034197 [Carnegiea gigantea]|uniref:Uncharacterized protein n=1 Tax=Carnegiea gigantea TaxID=171969 RepID=A0A9Q1GSF1_9CARY|nr:hypothetical protein Cgig2_034197 [Carnegiea gigantea]